MDPGRVFLGDLPPLACVYKPEHSCRAGMDDQLNTKIVNSSFGAARMQRGDLSDRNGVRKRSRSGDAEISRGA